MVRGQLKSCLEHEEWNQCNDTNTNRKKASRRSHRLEKNAHLEHET